MKKVDDLQTPTSEEVKAFRLSLGLSQTEFGKLIRYSLSGIQKIEGGERSIDLNAWELVLIKTLKMPKNKKAPKRGKKPKKTLE